MSNRNDIQIVLGSKRYQTSINKDESLPITLEGNQKEIEEFDRNNLVSLAQVFDDERQESTIFRPTAKIDLVFYNGYSGSTGINGNEYQPFTNSLFYVNSLNSFNTSMWSGYPQYNEFDLIRNDNNVPLYTKPSGLTQPHVYFVNKSATTYNWNQYVSYAYENDYTKRLEYYRSYGNNNSWICGDGIPFYIQNPYTDNGQDLISFVCPVEHNLSVGEFVELNIPGWSGYNGETVFQVYSLGQSGYNSDKFIFNIYNYGFSGGSLSNSTEGTFKRIIDITNSAETKSIYYVRKHKIITNPEDAILTNAGFDLNSFHTDRQYEYSSLTPDNSARITVRDGNQNYLLSFKPDIDIKPLVDNLKRPISELYITIINKGYFGWFNKPLDLNTPNYPSIRQGYGFNLTDTVSEYWSATNRTINKSNIPTNSYTRTQGATTYRFYYNESLHSGDTIDGAFCEFNQFDQIERVISDFYHKITFNDNLFKIGYLLNSSPFDLSTRIPNPEGYYYKPHNPITLKVYSEYVEEGNIRTTDGIPDYAYYSKYYDSLRWRDIYTYGYIDGNGNGVDYPFLNGTHYPSTKIIFRVIPEGNTPENIYEIADPTTDDCE